MVLGYLGRTHDEAEIAEACDTVPMRGTNPANAIEGIQRLGYQALWFENADLKRLANLVENKWPVIVFLRADNLPHGRSGLHCVVVIGVTEQTLLMLDPALEAQFAMRFTEFLSAWQALDAQGIVIWIES